MSDIIQSVITNVLVTVVCLLAVLLFIFLLKEWKRLGAWISARKAAAEAKAAESIQNALWSVAQEAYSKAESALGELAGSEKMDIALNYAVNRLRSLGIKVNVDVIRAKIQEAWVKLDKIPNQTKIDQDKLTEALRTEIEKAVQP